MMRSGIIVIDKPEGISSGGVVGRVRRAFGIKRVGHGGTLDPMASGVLPVFVGRATRASGMLLDADKTYRAGFILGIRTDTQDTTGTILERREVTASPEEVEAALRGFVGRQKQTPPMYSALKRDGKKLYELARKGEEVEREPREIEIYDIKYLGCEAGEHRMEVSCSKGTYIRTLVDDIGRALGCGAAMSSLRRERTGPFSIENAVPLDELVPDTPLLPTDYLWRTLPEFVASAEAEARIRCGANIFADIPDGDWRVFSESGEFLMLGRAEGRILSCVKNFFEVD